MDTIYVNCPICDSCDTKKTIDKDGNVLIFCVNHACKSNGGKYEFIKNEKPSGDTLRKEIKSLIEKQFQISKKMMNECLQDSNVPEDCYPIVRQIIRTFMNQALLDKQERDQYYSDIIRDYRKENNIP